MKPDPEAAAGQRVRDSVKPVCRKVVFSSPPFKGVHDAAFVSGFFSEYGKMSVPSSVKRVVSVIPVKPDGVEERVFYPACERKDDIAARHYTFRP